MVGLIRTIGLIRTTFRRFPSSELAQQPCNLLLISLFSFLQKLGRDLWSNFRYWDLVKRFKKNLKSMIFLQILLQWLKVSTWNIELSSIIIMDYRLWSFLSKRNMKKSQMSQMCKEIFQRAIVFVHASVTLPFYVPVLYAVYPGHWFNQSDWNVRLLN